MTPISQLCVALSIAVASLLTYPEQTPPVTPPPVSTSPKPNPDASGKYHIGDGVTAPKLIYSVEPEFSENARKHKISGNCVVSITVGTDGKASDVHVVTSIADSLGKLDKKDRAAALSLDEMAVKAAQQYRFEPAMFQGKPVPVDLHVEIQFQVF